MEVFQLLEDIIKTNINKSLKNYKYLVSDIDDTILDDNGELQPDVLDALISIKDKLCLATGRDYDFAKKIADKIGIQYLISSNGCLLTDIKNDKIMYIDAFSEDELDYLFRTVEKYPCLVSVECPKIVLNTVFNLNIEDENTKEFIKKSESFRRFNSLKLKRDLYNYIKENSLRVMVFRITIPEYNNDMIQELNQLNTDNIYRKVRSLGDEMLGGQHDIININISSATQLAKINAVKCLMKHLDIDLKDVVACGNGGNDVDMIKEVGLGIAMKNSCTGLLTNSDKITEKSNDDYGIIDVIHAYIK